MLKWIKKWWRLRKTIKNIRRCQTPAITIDKLLSAPMLKLEGADGSKICGTKSENAVTGDRKFNRPEPELPTHCPQCERPVTPSKIDDRVVACLRCKLMLMTSEAHGDPNIQRDITHANAGVTPKQTRVGGRISGQDVMDVLRIKRDIELGQATAFGEGYTYGKYGMSRAEYNRKAKQERENLENENE